MFVDEVSSVSSGAKVTNASRATTVNLTPPPLLLLSAPSEVILIHPSVPSGVSSQSPQVVSQAPPFFFSCLASFGFNSASSEQSSVPVYFSAPDISIRFKYCVFVSGPVSVVLSE